MVAGAAFMGFTIYVLKGEVADLTKDLATSQSNVETLKGTIKTQNKTIEGFQAQRQLDQKMLDALTISLNNAQAEKEKLAIQFDAYRGRLSDLARKKAGLIGRKATAATNKVFKDFEEATTDAGK